VHDERDRRVTRDGVDEAVKVGCVPRERVRVRIVVHLVRIAHPDQVRGDATAHGDEMRDDVPP